MNLRGKLVLGVLYQASCDGNSEKESAVEDDQGDVKRSDDGSFGDSRSVNGENTHQKDGGKEYCDSADGDSGSNASYSVGGATGSERSHKVDPEAECLSSFDLSGSLTGIWRYEEILPPCRMKRDAPRLFLNLLVT
jgi:hypothetical protein